MSAAIRSQNGADTTRPAAATATSNARLATDDRLHDVDEALHHAGLREALARPGPGRIAELRPQWRIGQESLQRGRQRGDVSRGHHQTGDAVLVDPRHA